MSAPSPPGYDHTEHMFVSSRAATQPRTGVTQASKQTISSRRFAKVSLPERIYACAVTSSAYAICREARRRGGISQRELAQRAGVSPSTVTRIERGRMEPTFDLLTRLVDACGQELRIRVVDIDWSGRNTWGDLSFEARLRAVHSATEFATAR